MNYTTKPLYDKGDIIALESGVSFTLNLFAQHYYIFHRNYRDAYTFEADPYPLAIFCERGNIAYIAHCEIKYCINKEQHGTTEETNDVGTTT